MAITNLRIVAPIMLAFGCATVSSNAQPVEWPICGEGNGHYYELVSAPGITWTNARDAAALREHMGVSGHLATVTSAAENAWIWSNVLPVVSETTAWIGGEQDPEGAEPAEGWMWLSGEAWDYTNWDPGEPNNVGDEDWLEMFGASGTWNDAPHTPDTQNLGYIVEYDTPGVLQWSTNGHYYALISASGIEWSEAKDDATECQHMGVSGYLATVTSGAENAWIWGNVLPVVSETTAWIGGEQDPEGDEPAGGWMWVTGEPWDYTNWDLPTEPNNHGGAEEWLEMFGASGTWNDAPHTPDTQNLGYIVEWDANPIPAVSAWGLVATMLLVLTTGTLIYARQRPLAQVQ